jgi:hypothetical protein
MVDEDVTRTNARVTSRAILPGVLIRYAPRDDRVGPIAIGRPEHTPRRKREWRNR